MNRPAFAPVTVIIARAAQVTLALATLTLATLARRGTLSPATLVAASATPVTRATWSMTGPV